MVTGTARARRISRGLRCSILVALALAAPTSALAQPKPASRELREAEARRACAAGQVEKGIEVLAELLVEIGHPNYVYNQARCYQQNGRAEEAINRFREYLRAAPSISASERQRVEGFVAELEAELARRGSTSAAGARPAETRAQTEPPVDAAPRVRQPPPERDKTEAKVTQTTPTAGAERSQLMRRSAMILGGVGLVAIAGGAFSSLKVHTLVQEQNDRLAEAHAKGGTVPPEIFRENKDAGERYATLQWVGYGVGAAALVGAVVCWVLGGEESASGTTALLLPDLSPNRAGGVLRVSF